MPRHGKDHLPRHSRGLVINLMNIQAYVDVGYQVSASKRFQLASLVKAIRATENNITIAKSTGVLLPPSRLGFNLSIWS
jgi:hypothetical protein